MCGIGFLYWPDQSAAERETRMRIAMAAQAHRGPDEEGIVSGEHFTSGHRRLSIIDLSASRQPMQDSSGRYTLSFNGEIYNYQSLRKELESRWNFATHGDTEVLLAGLVRESEEFLKRCEGMWAFALWDGQARTLVLGRDRMGKKPLYYYAHPSGMACASEIPALSRLTLTPWHEDEDSTADYLRYGFYLPGYTAYREVREVLPGHTLAWSPEGSLTQRSYWQLNPDRWNGSAAGAREALAATLETAVRRRLVADVEVGAFLSGGVDSSLVVGLMTRHHSSTPKTFTVGFSDAGFDERNYARRVAQLFKTDHWEEVLPGFDEEQLEQLIFDHIGQPFADSSILPTALVSRLAARHVKVALSGDGGDELFSGYQRYQARAILRWYTRLPIRLQATAHRAIRMLPEPMAHHSRSLLKKAHLFAAVAERTAAETPYVCALLFSPSEFAQIAPDLVGRGHPPPHLPEEVESDDIARMMLADSLVYLPQDILLKVDRASMAYGLETRAPFLDRNLVELAFSMPRNWHRRWFSGKRMLRKAFSDLLPSSIWRRRKQGFAVPVSGWMHGPLGDDFSRLGAGSNDHCLKKEALTDMLRKHREGIRDRGQRLWAIYVYLLWRNRRLKA